MGFSAAARLVLAGALLVNGRVAGQTLRFDVYPEFRKWWLALPDGQRGPMEAVLERYQARLHSEGVSPGEIARRLELI